MKRQRRGSNPPQYNSPPSYGTPPSYNSPPSYGTPPATPRGREVTSLHLLLIPITALVGLITWFICNSVYQSQILSMPRPALIGLMFVMLYMVLALFLIVFSNIRGTFRGIVITGDSGMGGIIAILLVGAVALFALAALFQWLYSLGDAVVVTSPTSYVFVIDDSGSMSSNDPSDARYDAIDAVLQGQSSDFPYMVYAFASDVDMIREMAPSTANISVEPSAASGGTALLTALERVMDDYDANVWDGGTAPKVILLTDGYAGDIGLFNSTQSTLDRYIDARISISTVGLGSVDESLMNTIAKTTGGVFLQVDDVTDLATTMASAGVSYSDRDLLSIRYSSNHNVLLGILRVVFLSILGTLLGGLMAVAYGFEDSTGLIVGSSIAKAVLGALLMELGTGVMGFSDTSMWCVLWILLAITIATIVQKQRVSGNERHDPGKISRNLF